MASYICKCGRVVKKSTTADNTGNRDTAGCEGCPYLLPWGPSQWDSTRHAIVTEVKGYECRMSPSLEYATYYQGNGADKCVLHIYSLDYDFLDWVSAWVAEQFPEKEISCSFDRSKIRATEFVGGLYGISVYPMQNKRGIAAKAALLHQFFDDSGHRKDKTPEEEKAIVLAAIEEGKAAARRKEDKEKRMENTQHTDNRGIITEAGELFPNGSECRRYVARRARTEIGKVQAIHVCDDQPDGVKIWLNASCPAEYWVLHEAGEIEGKHVESCPYCAAILKIGCGDVLLVPFGKELDSNKLPKIPEESNETRENVGYNPTDKNCPFYEVREYSDNAKGHFCRLCGSLKRVHRTCIEKYKDDWHNCNIFASYGGAEMLELNDAATDVQQGGGDDTATPTSSAAAESCGPADPATSAAADADLPEVCRGCQCATCSNEDCPTPCFQKDDEVEECKKLGPMGDVCEDYRPKEDAKCLKMPAPNGDAAASMGKNAAQKPQPEETMITQTSANSSSVPACPVDAGAATQNLSAADAASLAADPAQSAFDYSSLDAGTAERLQNLAQRAMASKKRYFLDLMEIVSEAHRELCDTVVQPLDNGRFSNKENTFSAWCASIGVGRSTAYSLLQVQALMDNSTPEEQLVLAEAPQKVLYAIAKPSTPAELVQAVKDRDITTHKQLKELEAQIKAERQAREQAERKLADAQREHQAECASTSALLRDEQQRRQKAEEGRIAAEKEKVDAQQKAREAQAQAKQDAALVEKLQDIVLQRDNEVAEQKERADAAEIRAQQAENRPVEVAVQAPTEEQINAAAKQRTAMLEAQLHTLQTQRDDAEKRADAAENNAYLSAAEFADKAATIIDGIRASFWAMAKELPDADFNQALEPLDTAVSRIYNREWEDGWDTDWTETKEDNEQ